MSDNPNFNVNDEFGTSIRVCADPTDPTCQTRVVLRQPAVILNQSEIPIQEIAESAVLAVSSSYATVAQSLTDDFDYGKLQNVFYVTQEGDDSQDGKSIVTAFRTIKRAAQAIAQYTASVPAFPPPRSTIRVSPGYYIETASILLPAFTSIVGNDLRTTVIRPTSETRTQNLFLVNNACYAYGLRLEGCEINDLTDPRTGFFFAFAPGAYIVTSPYIQNCTAAHTPPDKFYVPLNYSGSPQPNPEVGNGPGGMIVDDSVLDGYSPLKSMIVDAYTQVAFNGMGLVVRGEGYAQQVSFFTNFSHVGNWAIDGGHASLLNSNTTFGDYGLRASGKRILVKPNTGSISPYISAPDSDIVQANKNVILNYMMQKLQVSGSYSGSYIDSGSAIHKSTMKDAGILVDALVSDLKDDTPGRTAQFTQALFKGQDVSSGSIYTLPTASGFDKSPYPVFRVNDIFRYNQDKCKRDVGYILDALATDVLYGGNERSITAGTFYYKYPSIATTTQLQKTLDGLEYASNKAANLINTGSVSYQSVITGSNIILDIVEFGTGSIPQLIKNITSQTRVTNTLPITGSIIATGVETSSVSASFAIVSKIIENGTGSAPIIIPYTTPSTDPVILSAYNTLKNNITFIQEETIAYLSASWNTFQYDQTKCKRDIGYIVSGAAEDLLYGSNSSSIVNGSFYYYVTSSATTTQLNPTLDGINYASALAQQVILHATFTTASAEQITAFNNIRSARTSIQEQTIEFLNDALVYDFIRSWKYMKEYATTLPGLTPSGSIKIGQLIDMPINTITSVVVNLEPTLLEEFGSLVTSTSHDFSYAGSGVNFLGLPANQRGIGRTDFNIRVLQTDGGRVFYTAGDESGDFFAGTDFVIKQETGTIEGRTFNKALLARVTPLQLALETI